MLFCLYFCARIIYDDFSLLFFVKFIIVVHVVEVATDLFVLLVFLALDVLLVGKSCLNLLETLFCYVLFDKRKVTTPNNLQQRKNGKTKTQKGKHDSNFFQ